MTSEADKIRLAREALLDTALPGAAELAHVSSASSPTGESVAPRRLSEVLEDVAALEAFDEARSAEGGIVSRSVRIRRPYR